MSEAAAREAGELEASVAGDGSGTVTQLTSKPSVVTWAGSDSGTKAANLAGAIAKTEPMFKSSDRWNVPAPKFGPDCAQFTARDPMFGVSKLF